MDCNTVQIRYPFLSQIERVRVELEEKVARAHLVLDERKAVLMSELQQLEASYTGDAISSQIEQLRITKEQSIFTLTENENQETLKLSVAPLDARMRELEDKLDTTRNGMKEVWLEWDGKLEGLLNSTGSIRVRGLLDYRAKLNPILLAGKHREEYSTTPGEFQNPRAIAIHSETGNIYICDCGNNRVQVFNESLEFLFKISSQMKSPAGICINLNRVYVTQSTIHCLAVYSIRGKFIASAGREGNKELEFAYPGGVAVSTGNNLLYICDWLNNRIQCLNIDLSFNSFINNIPLPKDVKVTSRDIVVLTRGDPCIQVYDNSHVLSRKLIPGGGQLSESVYFCLDTYSNIIISAQCVLIYSHRGELIHKFGKFDNLRGIALDSNCRIVVVSEDTNSCVHLF